MEETEEESAAVPTNYASSAFAQPEQKGGEKRGWNPLADSTPKKAYLDAYRDGISVCDLSFGGSAYDLIVSIYQAAGSGPRNHSQRRICSL
jgi:hypothetical protein